MSINKEGFKEAGERIAAVFEELDDILDSSIPYLQALSAVKLGSQASERVAVYARRAMQVIQAADSAKQGA
jgi:hypothetical protein